MRRRGSGNFNIKVDSAGRPRNEKWSILSLNGGNIFPFRVALMKELLMASAGQMKVREIDGRREW